VGAIEDGRRLVAGLPAQPLQRVRGAGFAAATKFGHHHLHRRIEIGEQFQQKIRQSTRRHPSRLIAEPGFQHVRHLTHPHELALRDEALTIQPRRHHRQHMQGGDIAHINDTKTQPRQAGQCPVEQLLHHFQAGRKIGAKHRAEHGSGVDGHILHPLPIGRHPLPRRAFGERLRFDIGV